MFVTIKTQEELLSEGWQIGGYKTSYKSGYGMFKGGPKLPEHSLSEYIMRKALGQKAQITDYKLEGDNPKYNIRINHYTTWLDWCVIKEDLGTEAFNLGIKTIQIDGLGKIKSFKGEIFKFDCSFNEMTKGQLVNVIKLISSELGIKVTMKR